MATRQEIQVGHDLIRFAERANKAVLVACSTMQEIHPYTGDPIQYSEPFDGVTTPSVRDYTITELKNEADKNFSASVTFKEKVQLFLAKADKKLVDNGLDYYHQTKTVISSDMALIESAKITFDTSAQLSVSKEDLSTLGGQILPVFNSDIGSVHRPADIRLINIAHDCLDAISYELQGKNSSTGALVIYDVKRLKALAKSRCNVAIIEAEAAAELPTLLGADIQNIIDIATYVGDNVDNCINLLDLAILGSYIDANLAKLPLVRRHWSL